MNAKLLKLATDSGIGFREWRGPDGSIAARAYKKGKFVNIEWDDCAGPRATIIGLLMPDALQRVRERVAEYRRRYVEMAALGHCVGIDQVLDVLDEEVGR